MATSALVRSSSRKFPNGIPASPGRWKTWYCGFLAGCIFSTLWTVVDLMRAQDVFLKDFPEARTQVDYSLWAVNARAQTRAEFEGEAVQACQPGIVVRMASMAEWNTHEFPAHVQAFTATCPVVGAYQVVWKPGITPTHSLMLHELAGHAMGCWKHHQPQGMELFTGVSRHVMAPLTMRWAGLTVEDVACIVEGAFWPLYAEPELCFVEITPNFDLIAPHALGYYTRLVFVGSIEKKEYLWKLDRRVAGSEGCASARVQGGQVVMDDVRSPAWSGAVAIAPDGDLWRLALAIPRP